MWGLTFSPRHRGERGLCEPPISYSITLTFISLSPFCGSKSIGECSGSCLAFLSKPAGRLGGKLFSNQVSAFLSWEEGIWQGGTKGKRGLIWWNVSLSQNTLGSTSGRRRLEMPRWAAHLLCPSQRKKYLKLWQVSLLWLAAAKEEHHRRQKLAAASDSAAAEGPSEGVPRAVASCAAVSPSSSTLGNSEEQTGTEGVLPS